MRAEGPFLACIRVRRRDTRGPIPGWWEQTALTHCSLTCGESIWILVPPQAANGFNGDLPVWQSALGRRADRTQSGACHPSMAGFTQQQLISLKRFRGSDLTQFRISIPAPDREGYAITVFVDGSGIIADFGGLMQEFDATNQVIRLIEAAYSADVVLRVRYAGSLPVEWALCRLLADHQEQTLIAASAPTLISTFRKKSVAYKSNAGAVISPVPVAHGPETNVRIPVQAAANSKPHSANDHAMP